MDCEKFDNVMLDELYGELDELTSASAKRHLSGCARCTSAFSGMKATRRVAVLPLVDPPEDLEEKIFARVKEAQKVIPFRARVIRFVSTAGSWAMRPQTAMAAVFLLMVGSSVLFMRAHKQSGVASEAMRVSDEQGVPASPGAATPKQEIDYAAAASAHGTEPAKIARQGAVAANAAPADDQRKEGEELQQQIATKDSITNSGAPGGGLSTPAATAAAEPAPALAQQRPQMGQPSSGAANTEKKAEGSDLERGLAQYREKKYDDAVKTLDGISGSPDAALWSARALRDGKGCGVAAPKFDDLMARTFGTNAGYEATFDAAKCYEALGKFDIARARYSKLLSVPQYAARAQNELDRLRPVSVKPSTPMRSTDEKANSY